MTGDRAPAGGRSRENPYVGLVPFDEDDLPWFFGRDREQRIIGANLRSSRLTLLYGASGVGKSSVLQAAVMPSLRAVVARDRAAREREDAQTRSPVRFAVAMFGAWRDAPLYGLTSAVAASVHEATGEAVAPWAPGTSLRETFAGWLGPVTTLLIVLDQFEEHFLYHPHDDGPGTFAGEFVDVVNDPALRVNFLLALREDGLAKLDRFQGRVPGLFDNYLRVDHLDLAAARQAIEGPLGEYNRRLGTGEAAAEIDGELVDAVLDEVRTGEGVAADERGPAQEAPAVRAQAGRVETPLLQLVMQRLWQAAAADATPPHLRLATLREQLGGTERIVYRHLEDALAALSDERRDLAIDVLRPLVSPAGTKIAWRAEDLAYWAKHPVADIEPILLELSSGERRILRSVAPPPTQPDQAPRYEIFHDLLAEPILEWCAEREATRERQKLARELAQRERERKEAEERRRRERRNRVVRGVAIVLAVLVIGLVVAILAAFDRKEVADSRALAAGATSQLSIDPERGLLLALRAVGRRDTAEAEQALRRALVASRVRAVLRSGPPRPCRSCAGLATPARASGAAIARVAIAPDGSAVAAIVGGRVRLWRPRSGATFRTGVNVRTPRGLAFTSDAARLLVVGNDVTALMAPDGSGSVVLRDARATSGATSPDGRHVVTAGRAGGAAVWDARTGARLARVTDTGYTAAAFQTDGRLVLQDDSGYLVAWRWRAQEPTKTVANRTGAEDVLFAAGAGLTVDGSAGGRVRVVDASARAALPRPALTLPPGTTDNPVTDAAISPDGSRIATVQESVVELWRSNRRWSAPASRVGRLVDTDGVNRVVFSADGKLVGTASTDGTARVWESATGDLVADVRGHGASVESIAFGSSGRYVATAGEDLTVRLWDLGIERTLRDERSVAAVAVAPSGSRLAVAEEDGDVQLRALGGPSSAPIVGKDVLARPSSGGGARTPGSSPSTAPAPGPSPSTAPEPLRSAAAAGVHPSSLAFAGRAPLLLAGYASPDNDDVGRLRLLDGGGRVIVDVATPNGVQNVAIDRAGRVAAIVRGVPREGTRVELWSLAEARPARPLWRVPVPVSELATDVALSGDGRRLLVTGVYGSARVFDTVSRTPLRRLTDASAADRGLEAFYRATFSPDGKTVAVGGSRDVRLWDVASGKERGFRLSGHTSVLRSVAYDAGGSRLVTASADGTVRVWDARRGTALAVIARHAGRVNGAAFLRNGWIASGGDDRTVRLYPWRAAGRPAAW